MKSLIQKLKCVCFKTTLNGLFRRSPIELKHMFIAGLSLDKQRVLQMGGAYIGSYNFLFILSK